MCHKNHAYVSTLSIFSIYTRPMSTIKSWNWMENGGKLDMSVALHFSKSPVFVANNVAIIKCNAPFFGSYLSMEFKSQRIGNRQSFDFCTWVCNQVYNDERELFYSSFGTVFSSKHTQYALHMGLGVFIKSEKYRKLLASSTVINWLNPLVWNEKHLSAICSQRSTKALCTNLSFLVHCA